MRLLQMKALSSHLPSVSFVRRHADFAAVIGLFALTVVGEWDLFRKDITLGMDAAAMFYPFYYFLGESLWSGSIPAWNPYQFSGTPFAADPSTGWSYLPAMVLFTLLPLVGAAKGLMFLHLLLAGLSTYALARVLGMGIPGAVLAAVAYQYGGFLYLVNPCCFNYIGVMAWLPLAVLGAELAIRSRRWPRRLLWWGISGLALSQALASWFGQGSYYALLVLGGYVVYRTLLSPPSDVRGIRARVWRLFVHGGGVLLFGFALAAAGVLPRLEYNVLSNLAGGYPAELRVLGGWAIPEDWLLLLKPGLWYAGLIVLALALVAPLVARLRFAVPYFAALALCTLILTSQLRTPLHSVLYLLPYFERLHPHTPDRVILVFYLSAALLAGAALTGLGEQVGRKPSLLALPVLAALLLATASTLFSPRPGGWVDLYPLHLQNGVSIPLVSLLFLVSALVLVAAYALIPARLAAWRGVAFALLTLVVLADLLAANRVIINVQENATGGAVAGDRMSEMDLAAYYRPSGAARFLQSKGEEEPFRYFGYDPGLEKYDPELEEWWQISSAVWFTEPATQALEVNNRATLLGLQNVQGYNPTHIARYDEYMNTLNGHGQDYHFTDVYERGLYSPLLDLLNARYVIVPAQPSQENPEGVRRFERDFESAHPTVYEDDQTRVLESREALPRAWIVHSARQEGSGQEALDLLGSGEVDPKQTALLEEEPPQGMSRPDDPSADQVSVNEYAANRIKLTTSTETPGLLVLSEVYHPAWKAYVDGHPASVYTTNQLLRSVAIPAGEHEVELRYESWALRMGIAISLVALLALVALAVTAGAQYWRENKRDPS
jgi:Bacterial membrane protein YfhO